MDILPTFLGGLLAVLLLTSFIKMLTTLSILRVGMGLEGAGFGLVVAALALVLSAIVVQPQLEVLGGLEGVFEGRLQANRTNVEKQFRPFIERHADSAITARLNALAGSLHSKDDTEGRRSESPSAAVNEAPSGDGTVPFAVVLAAFLVTELKEAFELALLFIVPFVVIDLVVANLLIALSMAQVAVRVVSLPLKLLLFFALDGWTLVSEKLINGYL